VSVFKRCSRIPSRKDGTPNPLFCPTSPACDHHWWYRFRLNGRNYRATTQTALKRQALDVEARERSRLLEGRHGIRRQPDITFKGFAATYLKDHAELHKRSVERDREIIAVLNRSFGSALLHELTAHRIEQFKRERLAGKWRAHGATGTAKPIQPGTVNRELDTLRSILSKAVEWGKLLEHPMQRVKRLRVENRRTRILTEAEQRALLDACPRKFRALVTLALITGARVGELLALRWEDISDDALVFLETKNGKARRIPLSVPVRAVLDALPKIHPWVFTNTRGKKPAAFTVNGCAHVFRRAVIRAGILTGDVTLHTLRHTALSRMVAAGHDDYTVMALSGHSSTRMLARYAHPTDDRKLHALTLPALSTKRAQKPEDADSDAVTAREIAELLGKSGGRQEARTPDLRVANAALSQLS
jgi:integrase